MSAAGEPGVEASRSVGSRVGLVIDEIERGKGLLTCPDGDFSGYARREGRRFLVENERGDVLGYRSSWKAAGSLIASHHGYRLGGFALVAEWRGEADDGRWRTP